MSVLLYIILTLAGLAGAAFTIARSERKADLAITFAVAAAMVILADWVAFGWFGLYEYHPYLLADELADDALGQFLGDILFVPSLSVILAAYAPGWVGAAVGAAIVTGLEALFLRLEIFHHHGWALWATTVGFLFYFAALDLLRHDLRHHVLTPERLRAIVRGCLIFDMIALLTLGLRATRYVVTDIQVLPSYVGNQSLGRFITYALLTGPPAFWALSGRGTQRWIRIAALVPALAAMNWAFTAFGIQHFVPPWNGIWDALAQGATFAVAGLLEDLLMRARIR